MSTHAALQSQRLSDAEITQISDRLLTTLEAAQLLRTTARGLQVARCCRRETPPFIKLGRRVLYRLSDVEKWIAAHVVDPARGEAR